MSARVLALVGLLLLGACGGVKDNLVIVMPSADGHIGGVTVTGAHGQTLLDQPYAAVTAGRGATSADKVEVTAVQVDQIFGQTRSALPKPPASQMPGPPPSPGRDSRVPGRSARDQGC